MSKTGANSLRINRYVLKCLPWGNKEAKLVLRFLRVVWRGKGEKDKIYLRLLFNNQI